MHNDYQRAPNEPTGSNTTASAIPYDPETLSPACTLTPDPQGHIAADTGTDTDTDVDTDNDVDLTDYAAFQRCLTAKNIPADPACPGIP
jgi:hypothetical protein